MVRKGPLMARQNLFYKIYYVVAFSMLLVSGIMLGLSLVSAEPHASFIPIAVTTLVIGVIFLALFALEAVDSDKPKRYIWGAERKADVSVD